MNYTPIVLFVYNRPHHTQKVLDALALNNEASKSDLFVFCDGPKMNISSSEIDLIKETRRVINNEIRFKNVNVFLNQKNKGLANSIIDGDLS
jgi:hypothetical protein